MDNNSRNDLSRIEIGENGVIINISKGAEIPCPTCGGKGKIPDPQYIGKVVFYLSPNGDRIPHIKCCTCAGAGKVFKQI